VLQLYGQIDLSIVDLDSGNIREALSDPDYGGISALVGCVLHGSSVSLASPPNHGQTYYPATLHLLAMIAAHDQGCLSETLSRIIADDIGRMARLWLRLCDAAIGTGCVFRKNGTVTSLIPGHWFR